jgi:hypothetical protein
MDFIKKLINGEFSLVKILEVDLYHKESIKIKEELLKQNKRVTSPSNPVWIGTRIKY